MLSVRDTTDGLTEVDSVPQAMTPEELLEMLHGSILPFAKEHGFLRCDICFERATPPETVGIYASNVDVSSETRRPLRTNVIFCGDCNPQQIRIPRIGVVEIQMTADLIDEGGLPRLENPRIDQTSKTQDGIVWNPSELWEEVAQIPVPDVHGGAATAAHITEVLHQAGVDVEEIVQDDGSLDFTGYSRPDLNERVETYIADKVGGPRA